MHERTLITFATAPLLFLLTAAVEPQHIRYALDKSHSNVSARVAFLGLSTKTARFPDMNGTFAVSPADPSAVTMQVDIDARTLTTGDSQTKTLRGKSFFDVGRYPTLRFVASRMDMHGDRAATVDGQLTAKGITRPIRLDVTFSAPPMETGGTQPIELVANTTVDRNRFGMTAWPLVVGRMVKVTIRARMVPQG
ncbi:YceI family protein [Novosphingobium cyanobacteriorum]|uniref:YceI family protein n=1 Tax=Novosphingobium cyanobacteriorum TaxID=3024215 RepID=A0ABT6CM92_9SPHN|nr:YceI family protein [Novosphingobium cyanobacteriorum]MDF8335030.1 YceI family protein [Novosphingobium cyanobacteriorum]